MAPEINIPAEKEGEIYKWRMEKTQFYGEWKTDNGLLKVATFESEPVLMFYQGESEGEGILIFCSDKVAGELQPIVESQDQPRAR